MSQNITPADADAVNKALKAVTSVKKGGKYASNIPSRVKVEVGKYALSNGAKAALKRFSSKYPQYKFKARNQEKATSSTKLEDPIK